MIQLCLPLFVAALLARAAPAAAQDALDADPDVRHSAWRHRRTVRVDSDRGIGFAALLLPPQLIARSQASLADLRLLDGAREVPYVIDLRQEGPRHERQAGILSERQMEGQGRSVWTVDLGARQAFDTVHLTIAGGDFASRVSIEAQDEAGTWRTVRAEVGVFDWPWQVGHREVGRVHHTTISLDATTTARFLRLRVDDRRSAPLSLQGVQVLRHRVAPEERWRQPATLVPLPAPSGWSRYRIDAPAGWPVDEVVIVALDQTFVRQVRVIEEAPGDKASRSLIERGRGIIYRLHLPDAAVAGEQLGIPVERPGGGALLLEIENSTSPPLRGLGVVLVGPQVRLLFPLESIGQKDKLRLYYGNSVTRPPSYELEALREPLARHRSFVAAELGPEEQNPRYQPAAPLERGVRLGPPLDLRRWRFMRRLSSAPREDLYGVLLDPADLGALREDLGDVRIGDGQGRQIPFVLEPTAGQRRLELRIQRLPSSRDRRSRYRLVPELEPGHIPAPVPMAGLELEVAEEAFSRTVRLLGDTVTEQGQEISRRLLERREGRLPLRLPVPAGRYRGLVLEIDDGDDAPLHIVAARALLQLPRLAFQLTPELGECRLFLGNPEAEPPRYDVQMLRRQVAAYAVVPLPALLLQANTAYRPRAGEYVRSAPAALILWSTLLLMVLVLVVLMVRLVRRYP